MANAEHLKILTSGVRNWNQWRDENPACRPDLRGAWLLEADLSLANLREADLAGASLKSANLFRADLSRADLSEAQAPRARLIGADLSEASLNKANLLHASFSSANLSRANLNRAFLRWATFHGANLTGAILRKANLTGADLSHATLTACDLSNSDLSATNLTGANLVAANIERARIYGSSVWDIKTDDRTNQEGIIITPEGQPEVSVDDVEVAQFIYLLLSNEKLRRIIDTITSKVVLILGSFSDGLLHELRRNLRERGDYVPVVFDFEKPANQDLTGTVETLARMARFIIVDLTNPRSVPAELASIVPHLRKTAIQPIIRQDEEPYALFDDMRSYSWVLDPIRYLNRASLVASLNEILAAAEQMTAKLRR